MTTQTAQQTKSELIAQWKTLSAQIAKWEHDAIALDSDVYRQKAHYARIDREEIQEQIDAL